MLTTKSETSATAPAAAGDGSDDGDAGSQGHRHSRRRHRRDIQGLRAVAVLLVVLAHMGIPALAGGYVGVDVFFVVSGFLITGLLVTEATLKRRISFATFYARRARRILPAATVVLLATLVAAFFLLGNVRIGEIARETIWAALFAANWKFSAQGTDYFDSTLPASPLQHFWSLGVEEQFYLVWPALLFLVLFAGARRSPSRSKRFAHRPSQRRWLVLFVILGVIAGVSLGYSILYTHLAPTGAYFSTFTRAWELAVGALLAVVATQLQHLPGVLKAAMSWLGLVGIGLSAVLLDAATPFPGAAALLPVLSAALVVTGGIEGPHYGAEALLGIRPLTWLGDRSYSLYLGHWPALIIAGAYIGHDLSIAQSAAMIAVAAALTMLTYTFIEHPVHSGVLRLDRPRSLLLWPVSLAVLTVVALISLDAVRAVPVDAVAAGFGPPAATQPNAAAPATSVAPSTARPGQPSTSDPIGAAVAAAVASAEAGDPIPSQLAPSTAQLADDSWRAFTPENCYAADRGTTSDICSFGPDGAQRSMVILGNSTGGMWLAPLKSIAETNGWKLYYFIKTSCPVASLSQWTDQETTLGCPDWLGWALGEIQKLSPDVTLVSARGESGLVRSGQWEAGMVSTLETLKRASPRVVDFSQTAPAQEDPASCLERSNAVLSDCTWGIPSETTDLIGADKRASATAGAEFFDLLPWFCSNGKCPLVVNQMIVLYTAEHVTNTYGLALADSMAVALALT